MEDQDSTLHYQKRRNVTLGKRIREHQFSFCTPSLIRDTDKHVESGATLKNRHCDQLVMSALVSGQMIGGTYTINLLSTFW